MYTPSYILFLAFAEYVLMRPSEDYAPFMNAVYEKICMSKVRLLPRLFRTNVMAEFIFVAKFSWIHNFPEVLK